MKILKVWKNDYPWDIRVEKISRTLIDDGHEIHLVCSNTKNQKRRDNINGLQIHRLPAIKNILFNRLCSMPVFINPFWIFKLAEVVRSEKIEVIMIRDLPLVLTGIIIGKIYKIPVIFDMAENYPALWGEHVNRSGVNCLNFFLKNPGLAEIMENYALKKVAHVITVVEESENRILRKGINKNKVSIVSNTPDLTVLKERKSVTEENLSDGKFKLLYVGGVESEKRGVGTIIKSIPLISKEIKDLLFIVIGDGGYLDTLREMAAALGVEDYVRFCGRLEHEAAFSYIQKSDVCAVPHYATKHVNTTIPNKIFEYMACKKPVIVSDAAPLKRIVEENSCGVVFNSADESSFHESILKLKVSSVRDEMGGNGYAAVSSRYNWNNDSKELKKIFEKFR